MVTDYSNLGSTANDVLKRFYKDPIREQLNNQRLLMKRLARNTEDIQGGTAWIGVHTARNYGTGARPNGQNLPVMGTQTHKQGYTSLKFNYGRFKVSGPDIQATRGNRGAFVKLVDSEVKGLVNDLGRDINRQLFADGTGFLCVNTATFTGTAAGSAGATVAPYLWNPSTKYMDVNGMEIAVCDESGSFADYVPAEADTAGLAATVVTASCTYTENTTNTLYNTAGSSAILMAASDPISKWRAGMKMVSSTAVRREMMGIDGIVHDSDLPGDEYYYYNRDSAVQTWVRPEADVTGLTMAISANTNNLQAIDAQSNPFWRSKVYGNGGVHRALNLSMMHEAFGYQRTAIGITPTMIITTYKLRNKYAELMANDRRYVNTMSLDGGFSAVEYNGIPLTDDTDCPNNRMYMIAEPHLQLYVGQDFDWIQGGTGDVLHYISGYDAFEAVLRYYAELGTDRRNAHCKIIDLLET